MITVLSDIGIAYLALTGLVVLTVTGLVVLAVTDKPAHQLLRTPVQPSRVMPADDDMLALLAGMRQHDDDTFLGDGLRAEIDRMLREDGRG